MNGLRDDLVAAVELLTRVPVGRLVHGTGMPDLARIVWAYPVVGMLVGLIGGLAYWLAARLGCPEPLAALWALAALLLTTGALHEDGLADTADGFGGGTTAERKLDIMRDSRTGSYGVVALAVTLGLRTTAIALIADPGAVTAALVVAGAAGRGAMVGLLLLLRAARADGLGARSARPQSGPAAVALVTAVLITILLAPSGSGLAAVFAGSIGTLLIAGVARRQIGGQTGDVLGAAEQITECLVLTAIVATG